MEQYFEIIDEIDVVGPEALSSPDVYADVIVKGALQFGYIEEDEADDMRQCAIARYRARCYRYGVDGQGVYVERT